jgi:hypothetical protein
VLLPSLLIAMSGEPAPPLRECLLHAHAGAEPSTTRTSATSASVGTDEGDHHALEQLSMLLCELDAHCAAHADARAADVAYVERAREGLPAKHLFETSHPYNAGDKVALLRVQSGNVRHRSRCVARCA